jgi:hypothetical protein
MSNAVATRSPEVPALVPTPATTITAADIVVPRLYVGNALSGAVKQSKLTGVSYGDIYLAENADDPEPQVLWSLGSDEPGVLFHVLHFKKGLSFSEAGDSDLLTWYFGDPNADPRAWTTYQYHVILPEVAPDMPAKLLLTKSGKPTAQKINTVLGRNAATGPMYQNAFRLTSATRSKGRNEWAIFQALSEPANKKHVEAAEALYTQIAPGLSASGRSSTGSDEPSI